MKVLSFLEVNQLGVDERVKYVNWIINNFNWETRLVDFYAQPFKPELITEWFEVTHYKHSIIEGRSCYEMEINDIPIFINLYSIQYGDYTCEMMPQTINDFIVDCKIAGIELIWRKK